MRQPGLGGYVVKPMRTMVRLARQVNSTRPEAVIIDHQIPITDVLKFLGECRGA